MDKLIYEIKPDAKMRKAFYEKVKDKASVETRLVGRSILSRDIIAYKIGRGKEHIMYVGAHHGAEYITATLLMEFILFLVEKSTRPAIYLGINSEILLQKFTFWIVPCVNPDGTELSINGISESPLYSRQLRMNGGFDFTKWQANARGVDLNHNYSCGFAEYKAIEQNMGIGEGRTKYSGTCPESEPETRALAGFIRSLSPGLIVSLHSQGEEIFYSPKTARMRRLAERAARRISYSVSIPKGTAAFGGLSDYTGEILSIPSLTVEVGRGENPLPFDSAKGIFERILPLLYSLPTLL